MASDPSRLIAAPARDRIKPSALRATVTLTLPMGMLFVMCPCLGNGRQS